MKTFKTILLTSLMLISLTACNKKETEAVAQQKALQPVDTLMMVEDSVNARLADIMNSYIMLMRKQLLTDTIVLKTLAQTQYVIQAIEQDNISEAKDKLTKLIGELEVYLAKNPNAALVPVDVSYRRIETINNIDSVRALAEVIKDNVKRGYYQSAKTLMGLMTSEMIVSTTYIPVVSYLEGLKYSAALMDEGKSKEAIVLMHQVLSTVVSTTVSIPLPVLKAQIYIDYAGELYSQDHENIEQIVNLLDNAKYQLRLAEEMGYGKRDKEYKNLDKTIKELMKSVKAKEASTEKFKALHDMISKFRESFTKK